MKPVPNLIIVEAPQGGGKTTLTNYLRDMMPYTHLLRLSGTQDKTIEGREPVYKMHKSILDMIKDTSGMINYVMDRSHLSEQVYCSLGYKEYSFDKQCMSLNKKLNELTKYYNVYLVGLMTTAEEYEKRLKRDKPKYLDIEFNKESSELQQIGYYLEILRIHSKYPNINTLLIDTTNKTPEEVAKEVLSHLF